MAVQTSEHGLDAVIVGGGFAGVTTARELTMRGRTAVLVEARDRLGGRTYTEPRRASLQPCCRSLRSSGGHTRRGTSWSE